MKKVLLFASADTFFLRNASVYFSNAGFSFISAETLEQAKKMLRDRHVDLLASDNQLEFEHSGLNLLHFAALEYPEIDRILISDSLDLTDESLTAQTDPDLQSWLPVAAILPKQGNFLQLYLKIKSVLNV